MGRGLRQQPGLHGGVSRNLGNPRGGKIQNRLNEECADLEKRFTELAEEEHVTARLQALGGQFQVYFTDEKVGDYGTAAKCDPKRFGTFQGHMLREGIYTLPIPLFHH